MTQPSVLRRGLPRVRGGAPWPGSAVVVDPASETASGAGSQAVAEEASDAGSEAPPRPPSVAPAPAAASPDVVGLPGGALRRGLPRTPGGPPWPAGTSPDVPPPATSALARDDSPPVAVLAELPLSALRPSATSKEAALAEAGQVEVEPAEAAASVATGITAGASGLRSLTRQQRIRIGALAITGAGVLAALVVLAARGLYTFPGFRDFTATYPGEYDQPQTVPVGIPAWLAGQHAFNAFAIVLIIRSGLQVRRERRPAAFWTPSWNPQRRISLTLWFHQSLDLLWLANGLAYIVLLFATGQWMRIVPTSWEVLPNALSAAVQYLTLDWPTENGWVYYNSLQQLAYFVTVFVAAPLAVVTGVRMSGLWPARAQALSRLIPLDWAHHVHFPVMLYFSAFIVVHVLLVLATGALRNLNHMYAAQGSSDPKAFADNWVGFAVFMFSLLCTVAAVLAARPTVLAPIARLFGSVSR